MTTRPLKRVLFVDDDADIREVATMALETVGGLTVKTCAGGRAALAEIGAFDPDLVMLDVMMPDMDGSEVLRALRTDPATRAIPVIVLSAIVRPSEVQRLRAAGADDVFAKPFDPMTLSDRVLNRYNEAVAGRAADAADAVAAKTADLRARFRQRMNAEYDELERLVNTLTQDGPPPPQSVSDLQHRVHRIAGTAGTLGFDEIARSAADVESALRRQDWATAHAAARDLLPLVEKAVGQQ